MRRSRMWAWRQHAWGGPPSLDAARPPALRAPDHLLVRVRSASLNPIDAAMLRGYGAGALAALRRLDGQPADALPLTVGRDFYGEVLAAGPLARLRPGAVVWGALPPHCPGAHAELVVARDAWVGPAPESLGAAAGGGPYAGLTALAAMEAGGLRAGRGALRGTRVLLLGLGGVAQAALQLLRVAGAAVTVGCSPHARDLALELGAAAVLDRTAPDYHRLLDEHGPFEVALDAGGLGGEAARGGLWRCRVFVTLSPPALRLLDEAGLAGGVARSALALAEQNAAAAPAAVRWAFFRVSARGLELLRRRAAAGELRVPVERSFPWWEAREALAVAARPSRAGKLLLDWSAEAPPDLLAQLPRSP